MLRARRNVILAENLGPPVRFSDMEEANANGEEKSGQRAPLSRKPPSSAAASCSLTSHGHGKENRYQQSHSATPRERPPLSTNNRHTPNSTYPASLCGSTDSVKKSFALTSAQTPSSTFPTSLPINGARDATEPGRTETNGAATTETQGEAFEGKRRPSVSEQLAVKESKPCGNGSAMKEVEPALTREERAPPTTRESSYQSVIHKSKSVPQHLDGGMSHNGGEEGQPQMQRNILPSKLNLEQGMTRRASEDRGPPTPFAGAPPPARPFRSDSDIVTLTSAMGERRFKRLRQLGCGGSSKVFKVVGEEDYQTYALKEVYLKHVDPAIKSAYVNEIKLLKKLADKPEIITLHYYTFNKQEAILYLLLEYAEMDLNAVLKSHATANRMATVLYFWNQMLEVVKVIHDEGVIHNDLKPENFVCIGARLKLIDFGIANRIETEKTSIERDIRCGTINYMSPETIEANDDLDCFKVGRPSDVWSLGCILYQMVYGRTPFQHIKNKLKKWQTITDPSVAIPFPQISSTGALEVMKRCLSRNPKERPTVNELLAHPFSTMDHQ